MQCSLYFITVGWFLFFIEDKIATVLQFLIKKIRKVTKDGRGFIGWRAGFMAGGVYFSISPVYKAPIKQSFSFYRKLKRNPICLPAGSVAHTTYSGKIEVYRNTYQSLIE